jgi:uncharacterized membrane protein YadS
MKFKFYLRVCTHFLIAVIFAFVLASLFHSQFVMAELISVGVDISFNDRLSMSLDDLLGLYPTYGLVIAVSLLIAFVITTLLVKFFKLPSSILYFIGGGLGVATALLAMHPLLDTSLIAGARSTFGFICQSLAGAMGGWAFNHLRVGAKDVISSER